uniref:EMILIN-1-like isoform X1 n=2 Tax=Myxine glutinosa TaxID=7769 RepID=UPI003590296E
MYVRPSRRSCPWKHSKCAHFTTYHTYMKPIYRIGYKTVTELRWRCCPGFTSTNCQVNRPTGWSKGQGRKPHVSVPGVNVPPKSVPSLALSGAALPRRPHGPLGQPEGKIDPWTPGLTKPTGRRVAKLEESVRQLSITLDGLQDLLVDTRGTMLNALLSSPHLPVAAHTHGLLPLDGDLDGGMRGNPQGEPKPPSLDDIMSMMLEVKTVLRAKSEVLHILQDTVRSQAEQIRRLTEATRPSAVLPVPSTILLDTLLVDRLAELKGQIMTDIEGRVNGNGCPCEGRLVLLTQQAHQEAAVLRKHLNDSVSSILTDLGNLRSEVEGHSLHPLPGSHSGGVDLAFQGNASLASHHCCGTAFAQIADCERRISALEGRLVGPGHAAGTALHPSLSESLALPSDLDSRIRALERLCDRGPCSSDDAWLHRFDAISDRVHQNSRLISHLNKSMKVDGPTGKGVKALQGELTLLRLSFNTVNGSIRGLRDAVRALGGELTRQEVAEADENVQYGDGYGRTGRAVHEMTTTLYQKWQTCHRDNKTVDQECDWFFELKRPNSSHYLWVSLKRLNATIGRQQHQLDSLKVMQEKMAERLTTSIGQMDHRPLEKRASPVARSKVPAFSAILSKPAKVGKVIAFDKIQMNNRESYDVRTGVFWTPEAGLYRLRTALTPRRGSHVVAIIRAGGRMVGRLDTAHKGVNESSISSRHKLLHLSKYHYGSNNQSEFELASQKQDGHSSGSNKTSESGMNGFNSSDLNDNAQNDVQANIKNKPTEPATYNQSNVSSGRKRLMESFWRSEEVDTQLKGQNPTGDAVSGAVGQWRHVAESHGSTDVEEAKQKSDGIEEEDKSEEIVGGDEENKRKEEEKSKMKNQIERPIDGGSEGKVVDEVVAEETDHVDKKEDYMKKLSEMDERPEIEVEDKESENLNTLDQEDGLVEEQEKSLEEQEEMEEDGDGTEEEEMEEEGDGMEEEEMEEEGDGTEEEEMEEEWDGTKEEEKQRLMDQKNITHSNVEKMVDDKETKTQRGTPRDKMKFMKDNIKDREDEDGDGGLLIELDLALGEPVYVELVRGAVAHWRRPLSTFSGVLLRRTAGT